MLTAKKLIYEGRKKKERLRRKRISDENEKKGRNKVKKLCIKC